MYANIHVLYDFDAALFSKKEQPLISLYMPTHRLAPDNLQDPIRYKNLVSEVEEALAKKDDRNKNAALLDNFAALLEDENRDVWKYAKEGLAVLVDQSDVYIYHLDYPVESLVMVADTFHILPLIRNFQYGAHYYLLTLSAKNFNLFLGDFHALNEVVLPEGVEKEFAEVFEDFDGKTELNIESWSGFEPMFHGNRSKSELDEKDIEKFFLYVDRVLEKYFASPFSYPVILVSLTKHQGIFRKLSSFSSLLKEGIDKPFESMTETEVLEKATEIVRELQKQEIMVRLDDFHEKESKGLASTTPRVITRAINEKKVAVLFVEQGRKIFDSDFDDLSDSFVRGVLLQGGEVYVLDQEQMPSETGVAALFRY